MGEIHQSDFRAGSSRVRFDLTINVPTMVMLITLIASIVIGGVRIYNDLDTRVTRATYEIATLQERIRTFEATLAAVKADNNAQIQTLRNDIRSDLSEIKRTLNDILIKSSTDRSR